MSLRKIIAVLAMTGAALLGGAVASAPAHAAAAQPNWMCYGYMC